MGTRRPPDQARFVKVGGNVAERCGTELKGVARELPFEELVPRRSGRPPAFQDCRHRPDARPQRSERIARTSVDIGTEHSAQDRHDLGTGCVDHVGHIIGDDGDTPRACGRNQRPLHPAVERGINTISQVGREHRKPVLVVSQARLGGFVHPPSVRVRTHADPLLHHRYGEAMPLTLDPRDQALLDGEHGPAAALAMRVVVRTAESMQAERLLDITGAHIDSCLYHGQAGLDFAQRLADDNAQVAVPTTLNVSSLDLLHPELYRGDDHTRTQALALMAAYEAMGCEPTWTCAPYQMDARPALGENVAWAESNAIVFANAVLGARTHRYGDFLDIAAAITGRAPAAGLHLDAARHATIEFDVSAVPERLLALDVAYPVLGHHIGRLVGSAVPVVTGAPSGLSEDRLKAIGSAGASSGSLAMFHVVGSTPEAPDLATATGGHAPESRHHVTTADLRIARDQLTTSADPRLGAISLGTPHYSVAEFGRLIELLGDRRVDPEVHAYVNTGRTVALEIGLRGWTDRLHDAGIQIVTDTCTYITPVMADVHGTAMTDSAKWAYYAPGNLGLDVAFGSVEDCVESAVCGEVVRNESVWADA